MAIAALEETLERTTAVKRRRYAPLPGVLHGFWAASLVAFALIFVVRSVERRMGFPPSFYYFMAPRFSDLLEYVPTFRLLHSAAFFGNPATSAVAYPPFGAVLFALIYSFGKPVAFYLAVAAAGLGAAIWSVRNALIAHGVNPWTATLLPLTLVLVSFPIEGLLECGNIELFVWLFAAAGTWFYLREQHDAAAVLWALAAATKLYPVIFCVLLLARKRYRAFAVGMVSFMLVSVVSMWYLGPDIATAWHGSLRNVFGYQSVRAGQWNLHELAANHSAFILAKLMATVVGFPLAKLTLPYYALGALIFAAVFFGRVVKMPAANQLLAVSVFMLMLPTVSYFYTLVHLYAPWLVLMFLAIRASRAGVRVPGLHATMVLFLPLFVCFTLYTFPAFFIFAGIIQACLLVVLFICAALFPFCEPRSFALDASPVKAVR